MLIKNRKHFQQILIFFFFFFSLVIPEFSQEYSIRVEQLGSFYLQDILFLFLLFTNIKKIIIFVVRCNSRYPLIIFGFIPIIFLGAVIGFLYGNPSIYILREVRFLGYSFFFFFTVLVFKEQKDKFINISLFIGVLISLRGIYEQVTGTPLVVSKFYVEDELNLVLTAYGVELRSFSNPILLFTTCYAFIKIGKKKTWFYLALFLLYLNTLIFSFARNLYISVLFSLIILVASQEKKIKGFFMLFLGIIGLKIFLSLFYEINLEQLFLGRLIATMSPYDPSYYDRLNEFNKAIELFLRKPIFGVGLGYRVYYWFLPIKLQETTDIHNTYLYFLVKTGMIGLVYFLMVIFKSIVLSLKTLQNYSLTRVFFASLIGYCIMFAFAHHISGSFFTGWFFSLLGMQYIIYEEAKKGVVQKWLT